jgi:hypothetical protein
MVLSFKTLSSRIVDLTSALLNRGRYHLLYLMAYLSGYKFTCRVQQFTDESQPVRRDQFFRIQMAGRILTPRDNVDTNVKLEILDITAGQSKHQQVFSADEQFRGQQTPEFKWTARYGIVVEKDTLLDHWVTIIQFPCHILRLPYRGRRKLLFRVTVLENESDQELVACDRMVEYVYCADGYRELHGRRLDILRGCVTLAAIAANTQSLSDEMRELIIDWIHRTAETFLSEEDVLSVVSAAENSQDSCMIEESCEPILAFGEDADRFRALDLSLLAVGIGETVTPENIKKLSLIAEKLQIPQPRFLRIAQKALLSFDRQIEDPSLLLGISSEMDADAFRKQLNEEYRKWNARVTHPDPQIRSQADQMLNLIAEMRSRCLQLND